MSVTHFETKAGQVTRGECYALIMDLLRQTQDQYCIMAHLHNTEGNDADKLLAKGWLGMAEITRLIQHKVTALAQNKIEVMR